MTKTIDVSISQSPLAEVVALARAGADIVLAEGGRPLFRLVPVDASETQADHHINGAAESSQAERLVTPHLTAEPEQEPYLVEQNGFLLLTGVRADVGDWNALLDRDREARLGGFESG